MHFIIYLFIYLLNVDVQGTTIIEIDLKSTRSIIYIQGRNHSHYKNFHKTKENKQFLPVYPQNILETKCQVNKINHYMQIIISTPSILSKLFFKTKLHFPYT